MRRLPGAAAGPGRPPHPGALPDRPQDLRGPGPTVGHLSRQPGALEIVGKGGKPRLVACPAALSHRLKAYAFDRGLGPADRLFPVGRKRAWQIIGAAAAHAGLGEAGLPPPFSSLRSHRAPAADRQPPGPAAALGPRQPAHDHAVSLHPDRRGGPAHQPTRGSASRTLEPAAPPHRGRPLAPRTDLSASSPLRPPEAFPPLHRLRASPHRQRHHHHGPGYFQRRGDRLQRQVTPGAPCPTVPPTPVTSTPPTPRR